MSEYLRVVNWPKFQHYKLPNPSWIKIYRSLLTNYEFTELPDDAKGHLVMLWLLAAETGNKIPNNHDWIERKINSKTKVNFRLLTDLNFIEIYDSRETLEKLYNNSRAVEPDHSIPEKRREEKRREEKKGDDDVKKDNSEPFDLPISECSIPHETNPETLADFLISDEVAKLAQDIESVDSRIIARQTVGWLPEALTQVDGDFIMAVLKTFLKGGGGPSVRFKSYLNAAIGKELAKKVGENGIGKSNPRNYGYSDKNEKPYTGVTINVD